MSENLKSILYAAILCLVCSLLLTTVSAGLQERQSRNVLIDRYSNLLKSVGLFDEERDYSGEEIEAIYNQNIRRYWINNSGDMIPDRMRTDSDFPLYLYMKNDEIVSYIVPINSRGLWGRIRGYLAIDKDGSTIAGFTVFKHVETPGLGAEIEKGWFQKNWVGKKIVDVNGNFVSVGIAKGAVAENLDDAKKRHMVDGISGATMTGKFMTDDIKGILEEYEPVSIRFRNNLIGVPNKAEDESDTDNNRGEEE